MTQRAGDPSGGGALSALEDPTAAPRRWMAELHERMLASFDGVGRTARRLVDAAGPGAVVVRSSRPPGWAATAAVLLLVVAVGQHVTWFVTSALTDGSVDLLPGRGALVLAVLAAGVDLVLRLAGVPLVAVGPAGVALAFPPGYRVQGPSVVHVGAADAATAVDLVPWSDVAAVVQVRDTAPSMPVRVAQVGVRLRRPLSGSWPRETDPGTLPPDGEARGFGTSLLTRPVAALDEARATQLAEAVERFAPRTPFEDVELRSVRPAGQH